MFEKTGSARYKKEVKVTVTLTGQKPFAASVFLMIDERLIDLLNDLRAFIPMRKTNGSVAIVAKANIVSIIEAGAEMDEAPIFDPTMALPEGEEAARARQEAKEQAEAEAAYKKAEEQFAKARAKPAEEPKEESKEKPRVRRTYDPYEVLRVARDASTAEIRRAYKARMKAVHPDAIAALDLDEDLERAALLTAQKVNHAYQQLMKERKAAAKADAESDAA